MAEMLRNRCNTLSQHGRAPISGYPHDLPCPHCRGVFIVAWDEHYLKRR